MAFAAARMILKDKRRKSKEDFAPPRQRSKVASSFYITLIISIFITVIHCTPQHHHVLCINEHCIYDFINCNSNLHVAVKELPLPHNQPHHAEGANFN